MLLQGDGGWSKQHHEFTFKHFEFMRWHPSRDDKETGVDWTYIILGVIDTYVEVREIEKDSPHDFLT